MDVVECRKEEWGKDFGKEKPINGDKRILNMVPRFKSLNERFQGNFEN